MKQQLAEIQSRPVKAACIGPLEERVAELEASLESLSKDYMDTLVAFAKLCDWLAEKVGPLPE